MGLKQFTQHAQDLSLIALIVHEELYRQHSFNKIKRTQTVNTEKLPKKLWNEKATYKIR